MITTAKNIIRRPHADYIEVLQMVEVTRNEAPSFVDIQRVEGLLSSDEIWSYPSHVPYSTYEAFPPEGLLDFVCGFEWRPRPNVRRGTAVVRINAQESRIDILNNVPDHHQYAVGLSVAGYHFHKIDKDPMIEYLTAVNKQEVVALILLLIAE